ncbi:putative gustatory receptor 59b [Drosophila tropicalis]|uniref:putative gustatory receptor 59b n=1 Tax=Drosophila tropicalis TaxID=46794 RepID=UPI0035ABA936
MKNFCYFETCFTRIYALILNAITLVLLPVIFLRAANDIMPFYLYPKLMAITVYVNYVVNYAAIVYTLVSRVYRDKALMQVQRIILKLQRFEVDFYRNEPEISRLLTTLFYLKCFTTVYLSVNSLVSFFEWLEFSSLLSVLAALFFNFGINILGSAVFCYFLALWRMSLGFECINREINRIISSSSSASHADLVTLRQLWSVHAQLSRTVLNVNRMYGLQMLVARFYYVTFTVIYGYWGIFFTFDTNASFWWIIYGSLTYTIRTLDFYLLDYICDLIVKYQSPPKHEVTEGNWFKELNSYVIYGNSSRISLWVCGLFKVDRQQWFEMMGAVLSYSVVLMQFHFYLKNTNK